MTDRLASTQSTTSFDHLIDSYSVVICGGTGGVGKTTVSAALGIAAAQRGKRVLVLTVDPARRLASALGLGRIDHQLVQISLPATESNNGQLWISMLQPERIFEQFINQACVSESDKQRLKHNRLFRQLSSTLSGSQEFTSLMWLQQLAASGDYDLIVLDTPPSDHAIDFLHAPERLAALFEGAVAKFFAGRIKKMGLLNQLLVGSGQLWLKALSKITGAEFIEAVSDFVASMGPFANVIAARSRAAEALLKSDRTGFYLVASPDPAKLQQGLAYRQDLHRAGYALQGVIINRAYPRWFLNSGHHKSVGQPCNSAQADCYQTMTAYFDERIERVRKSELLQQSGVAILELPELTGTLAGPAELEQLASYLVDR